MGDEYGHGDLEFIGGDEGVDGGLTSEFIIG